MSASIRASYTDIHPEHLQPETLEFRDYVNEHHIPGSLPLAPDSAAVGERHYLDDRAREQYLSVQAIVKILRRLPPDPSARPILFKQKAEEIHEDFQRIFCTLLYIGRAHKIYDWLANINLKDRQGPWESRPDRFPDNQKFWTDFHYAQWMFFVERLKYRDNLTWPSERILPFHRQEQLAEGDSAVVYKVLVNSDYNGLFGNDVTVPAGDPRNTLCLKTFFASRRTEWTNESSVLSGLRSDLKHDKSTIMSYGCYQHGETCNILLEYADCGTLEDYMGRYRPPTTTEEISEFWHSVRRLISVLGRLENMDFYADAAYQGWHFDIKSENILVCSQPGKSIYGYTFKLADFGSTMLRVKTPQGSATVRAAAGTKTNAPPELCSRDPFAQNRKSAEMDRARIGSAIDSWSLGCVFSEVATWVVQGYSALEVFRKRREDANLFINRHSESPGCFHDGTSVLQAVLEWHAFLRATSRRSDRMTQPILNIVESKMLVPQARRLDGKALLQAADNIFERSSFDLIDSSGTGAPLFGNGVHDQHVLSDQSMKNTVARDSYTTLGHDSSQDISISLPFEYHDIFQQGGSEVLASTVHELTVSPGSIETDPSQAEQESFPPYTPTRVARGRVLSTQEEPGALHSNIGARGLLNRPSPQESSWHSRQTSMSPIDDGAVGYSWVDDTYPIPERSISNTTGSSINHRAWDGQQHTYPGAMPHRPPSAVRGGKSPATVRKPPDEERIPFLGLETVEDWARNKRKGSRASRILHSSSPLPMTEKLIKLVGRDFYLLFDNSYSMSNEWHAVTKLASALMHYLKRNDENGVDAHFYHSRKVVKIKSATEMHKVLTDNDPSSGSKDEGWQTDMHDALSQIIGPKGVYRRSLDGGGAFCSKKAILFVFTDGNWEADPEKRVHNLIRDMVGAMKKAGPDHFGIQFIRFGGNELGSRLLKELDDNILDEHGSKVVPDIVDTEPYSPNCNVLKILLGSVNKYFDRSDNPRTGSAPFSRGATTAHAQPQQSADVTHRPPLSHNLAAHGASNYGRSASHTHQLS